MLPARHTVWRERHVSQLRSTPVGMIPWQWCSSGALTPPGGSGSRVSWETLQAAHGAVLAVNIGVAIAAFE